MLFSAGNGQPRKRTQCRTHDKAHKTSALDHLPHAWILHSAWLILFASRPQVLRDDAFLFLPAKVPAVALSQRNQRG
jgi:hypothetical protein